MRNRHDGANVPEWWDDLPPAIKKRCANSPHLKTQSHTTTDRQPQHQPDDSPSSRLGIVRDLSWFALILVAIAFANLIFLLVALSFLHDRGLFPR
jgi:hypothetical protein